MRITGQHTIFSGWSRFLVLDIALGDGRPAKRQLEDHGEAAAVLPYDAERRVALLVVQPRLAPLYKGMDALLLEAAAGIIDPGETPTDAALREAFEEAGVRLIALEPVAWAWSIPSVSSERIHLYLAPYRAEDRISDGGGLAEEGEEIEVVEMPLKAILAKADAGELTDMKTLILVWALARRRPDLFL